MLDNFSLPDLARGVELVAGRAVVEASGTVTPRPSPTSPAPEST